MKPTTLAAILATLPLTAQSQPGCAASSATFLMPMLEFGSGGTANAATYAITTAHGAGVVVEPRCAGNLYQLVGGFPAGLDAPTLGRQWLCAVQPLFVKPNGNATLELHGTEMDIGSSPAVTIGGIPAVSGPRGVETVLVSLPDQLMPGFQPVVFSTSAGTSTLAEGVGVLPLLELREPLNGVNPNFLRCRGVAGDFMLLMLAEAQAPSGLPIIDFRYELRLEPTSVVFTNVYALSGLDGVMTIPLPPFPSGLIQVQALMITSDPGYYPGSFTNAVAL